MVLVTFLQHTECRKVSKYHNLLFPVWNLPMRRTQRCKITLQAHTLHTQAHQLEAGVLAVRWPLRGLIVTLTWIVSGAFVPCRGLAPWLLSTVHIITLTAALTSQQQKTSGQVITELPGPPGWRDVWTESTRLRGLGTLDWKIKVNLLDTSSHAHP